jgi:hypothetical protein
MMEGMMRKLRLLFTVISVLLPLLGAAPAFAQGGLTFGLRPADTSIGYFEYTMMPGEALDDAVVAVNATEDSMRLKVSVVAGHTALTGGVSFQGAVDGPAEWIDLPNEGIIEVPGQRQVELPFTVQVPRDAQPGEYVAGFLVSQVEPEDTVQKGSTMAVQVVPQMGLTMIITVPGEQHCEVRIDSISDDLLRGQWKLQVNMENVGNVHFRGEGEVEIRPVGSGQPVLQKSFEIGYFVAGDPLGYPIYFDSPPPDGEYEAHVAIRGTDCPFSTEYMQGMTITPNEAELAQREAEKWARAEAAAHEAAAKELAQAEKLRSIGLLLLGSAALILIALLLVILLTVLKGRQQPARQQSDVRPPRR